MANTSNLLNDTGQHYQRHSREEQIVLSIFGALMVLTTLLGNLLVLVVYFRKRKLQTITNMFLVSLAVSDIVVALVPLTFYLVYSVMGRWPFGELLCDSYLVVDYVCCQVSVNHLVVICIDRLLNIFKPFVYRKWRSKRHARIAILVTWIVSFLQWTPWILLYEHMVGIRTIAAHECHVQFLYDKQYMSYVMALFAYYLPVGLLIVGYLKIYAFVKTHLERSRNLQEGTVNCAYTHSSEEISDSVISMDNITEQTTSSPQNSNEKQTERSLPNEKQTERRQILKHKKAAKMLFIICAAFAVTWLPYNLLVILGPYYKNCLPHSVRDLAYFLCYFNSTINPFCYALGSPTIRREFKKYIFFRKEAISQ